MKLMYERMTQEMLRKVQAQQDALWQRQLELWPNSVRLTPQEVIQWALETQPHYVDPERRERRLRAIAMALQYPAHVWYRLPKLGTVSGCRIGFFEGEYLSNFSEL